MLIYNPRQMALVTCKGKHALMGKSTEKHDIVPTTWHSPASSHPPMYAIFLENSTMACKLITQSGAFVVNFMPNSQVESVKKAQVISGEYTEKIEHLGLHELPCEKLVDSFRIKEAVGWLECELVEEKSFGDHILFVGRVVHSWMALDEKRVFHVEGNEFTTTR
ncbi:flavin reductase family protein [Candidatus Woesearchaeota archaeon]|nr:flavin reductase family protein [Candidatus Woesearchaeota archaeon]